MVSLKFAISGTEQHNRENAMQEFINKFRDQIHGTLSGFDRLVLRGSLRRLNYGYWDQNLQSLVAQGMEHYLSPEPRPVQGLLGPSEARQPESEAGERQTV